MVTAGIRPTVGRPPLVRSAAACRERAERRRVGVPAGSHRCVAGAELACALGDNLDHAGRWRLVIPLPRHPSRAPATPFNREQRWDGSTTASGWKNRPPPCCGRGAPVVRWPTESVARRPTWTPRGSTCESSGPCSRPAARDTTAGCVAKRYSRPDPVNTRNVAVGITPLTMLHEQSESGETAVH